MQEIPAIANPQLRCTHVQATGRHCGSYAIRGEQFCYHHHQSRPPAHRYRAAVAKAPFVLPVLSSRRAVQIALAEIAIRIADNTLDTKRASLLLQCLQMAAATHTT